MPDSPASNPVLPFVGAQPVARSREHPIEVQTRVELVRMAYRELMTGTLASLGTALAFAAAVFGSSLSSPGMIGGWFAVIGGIALCRFWLAHAYQAASPSAEESARWGLRYIMATTATAVGWGASAWLFPTLVGNQPMGIVHVLMFAGLTTGSARLLMPMRKGSLLYLLAMMVPMGVRFLANGDLPGITMGVCVFGFIAYMAVATQRNHKTLSDALVLRFEREALAAELQAENARRESREVELQEAREKAESASRAKGEFLATISHEIRTPMNGVLGMLRIVRDTNLSSEQRGYLKTASDSAEALLLLLNDVLDFSKIEAGRLELEHAPFQPSAVAKAVNDLLHARARDKGLQFELQMADNLPGAILGDATRLRQILVNLIGNAIKFTEKGRVQLTVACPERTAQRATMQFTVTDTGIGIDSAVLEKLFKPFMQGDTSMSRRYGGTGLGLVISQRLAQAMGGALQVQSTVNQGTTFRLILPCKLPDMAMMPPRPDENPRFVTPVLQARILVVEDDSVNQQVIDLFLKKLSVTAKFALDGEAAITTATSEEFDIILMDCQLPGIDGLETTRRIRQKLAGTSHPKIIALTANASTHVREACLAAGMDDFLTKPVRFELLANVLQRNLAAAVAT